MIFALEDHPPPLLMCHNGFNLQPLRTKTFILLNQSLHLLLDLLTVSLWS